MFLILHPFMMSRKTKDHSINNIDIPSWGYFKSMMIGIKLAPIQLTIIIFYNYLLSEKLALNIIFSIQLYIIEKMIWIQ